MSGMLNLKTAYQPKGQAADSLTADGMLKQMHLQPDQRAQLDRIVTAGMKVMFAQQTHKLLLEQMNGPGTMQEKVGKGVAGLMGLLMQESQNSLPPALLIPAGFILTAKAAEFLRESGTPFDDSQLAQALTTMTTVLLQAMGLDPDKLAAAGERGIGAPTNEGGE